MATQEITATGRPFDGWHDVMEVHRFLVAHYADDGTARTWETRRWEGQWWHDDPDRLESRLRDARHRMRIWEDGGRIVAVAHPEGRGDVHLQVDRDYEALADEILDWAERAVSSMDGGRRRLTTYAPERDDRAVVLRARGYVREDWAEIHRWRRLDLPIVGSEPHPDYRIRGLRTGDAADAGKLAELINIAFGHDFGPEALLNFERAPSFVAEGQIVAEASDGAIAAHAGVSIDHANRLAIVEPVCTHPDHRRRGLAASCITHGLDAARRLGAASATVSTGSGNPSDLLYARLGFVDQVTRVDAWRIDLV